MLDEKLFINLVVREEGSKDFYKQDFICTDSSVEVFEEAMLVLTEEVREYLAKKQKERKIAMFYFYRPKMQKMSAFRQTILSTIHQSHIPHSLWLKHARILSVKETGTKRMYRVTFTN